MAKPILITTFYKFFDLSESRVNEIQTGLNVLAGKYKVQGLVILGAEGINTTMSMPIENAELFKKEITALLAMGEFFFKDSFSDRHPFHNFKVKIRSEIVTLERPEFRAKDSHKHLSPDEWQKVMESEDVVILDTRNDYEFQIGHFKNAINPQIDEFTEFPDYLKNSGIPKDKKLLIYCTGGIRCEKAIYEAEAQGYTNTYQLEGGILNYLKEHPNKNWNGECFVFDYRVAVDQNLEPSKKWLLCPHCGDPGDQKITCDQCGIDAVVCTKCLEVGGDHKTCSKNCAHHFRMGHKTTKIHWDGLRNRIG